ncbi:MAG: HAD family acid phosphatase [Burkholderiales bacterium]|nr:HAD family acid phosphatase [Burkholderiales bacterium]
MKKIIVTLLAVSSYSFAADVCAPSNKSTSIEQSVKWYRTSAEKNALYHQAFGIGTMYVEKLVQLQKLKAKTWGVVLDIDETTLDNSWYFKTCKDLAGDESNFSHYVANPQKSTALPGVKDFVATVHKLGGYVSLVSNRDGTFEDNSGSVMKTTIANLQSEGIYFDQIILANRRDSKFPSDKNPRFNAVTTGNYDATQMVWSNKLPAHQVIAYFGDNIQDFPVFKQAKMEQLDINDSTYNKFGNGYFIMPNPMYGSWGNMPIK